MHTRLGYFEPRAFRTECSFSRNEAKHQDKVKHGQLSVSQENILRKDDAEAAFL